MVNLGLGDEVTSFKTTLVTPFNQTGNGTYCFKHIPIPESIKNNITEGTTASLQIVMLSTSGGALYNVSNLFSFNRKGEEKVISSNPVMTLFTCFFR